MKFSNIIRNVILEQGRYEILLKTYTTPKKTGDKVKPAKMKVETLDKLVKADPTTRLDGDKIKKAGEYVNWIIKQYLSLQPEDVEYGSPQFERALKQKQELFFEDLYKTTEDLEKFDRFKGRLPQEMRDINSLNIDSLFDAVREFSLEKTKASKEEKKQAATTYEHPGGEVIFRGQEWTVVKINDTGQIGKDAACFYGGNQLRSGKGETNWCTSAPGLDYFNRYIKDGPLYVVIPNKEMSFYKSDLTKGEQSGLPALRYQFHFPSNQFMDPDDRQIDLIKFLNENPELKEIFKPEFMKGISKSEGTSVSVEYPRDSASKFIALYGFDEFFESLPENIERFDFVKSSSGGELSNFALKVPSTIGKFKKLHALHLEDVVQELPKEIGNLENLVFLSLPNNKNLKSLPKEIANLSNLQIINLKGSNPNVQIPKEIENAVNDENRNMFLFR
jgi:hypothetical protein